MPPLAVNVISGLVTGLALGVVWFVQENVFSLPDLFGAVLVPGALANIAFVATLIWHARLGRDDLRTSLRVLGTWLVVCPLVAAAVCAISLAPFALVDAAAHAPALLHKVQQAGARAVLAVGLAAWLLIRGLLRKLRSA